jgi:3-oxoacyl-[acyl-carrier-protein] synthase II
METDHLGRPIVVITGMGVITSLGQGKDANWQALTQGRSGIRQITRFPIEAMKTRIAGTVDFIPVEDTSAPALSQRLAELVIDEAIAESNIGTLGRFPGPLFLALPPVEMDWPKRFALAAESGANDQVTYDDLLRAAGSRHFDPYYHRFLFASVGEALADRFGTIGSPIATSTACASGGTAIQLGVEAIRRGEAEAALVVGTDASVNPESLIRFSLLSALSTRNDPPTAASRPFSKDREGFVMAEGAGALVLESLSSARARGAKVLAVLEGCGEQADGFHRTRSSPDGKPIIACMRNALADAGLEPDAVGYINAHGTGTMANDPTEVAAIRSVFGSHAGQLAISSTKSMHGHALGAAAALEALASIVALREGVLPPTANFTVADPDCDLDVIPNQARETQVEYALSNSFAFGGLNAVLACRQA